MGSTLEEFRAAFEGEALLPADAGYDDGARVWNGDIDRRPGADRALRDAGRRGQAARAFARGEGWRSRSAAAATTTPGSPSATTALMIDLSPMADVTVDPPARRARCGGGATWADARRATQAHGLAVTGGFISHTGIGGLTLGGGMGWLTAQGGPELRQPRLAPRS